MMLTAITVMEMTGCESEDRRLVEYAQRATEQQARQNERIAQQSESVAQQSLELASATQKLVEQDAVARRELIQAQNQLHEQNHVERSALDRQREQIHAEQKSALAAAVRDPVVAQAIITSGLFLAALLPLLVTVYAIRRLPAASPVDDLLADSVLEDFVTGQLLHLQSRPEHPLLPGGMALQPDDSDEAPALGDISPP